MMVTVDGGVFEALLSNMVPGKTYQVTVSSVKGLEESDPSTDTVTTGSALLCPITSAPGCFHAHSSPVSFQLWTDRRA